MRIRVCYASCSSFPHFLLISPVAHLRSISTKTEGRPSSVSSAPSHPPATLASSCICVAISTSLVPTSKSKKNPAQTRRRARACSWGTVATRSWTQMLPRLPLWANPTVVCWPPPMNPRTTSRSRRNPKRGMCLWCLPLPCVGSDPVAAVVLWICRGSNPVHQGLDLQLPRFSAQISPPKRLRTSSWSSQVRHHS